MAGTSCHAFHHRAGPTPALNDTHLTDRHDSGTWHETMNASPRPLPGFHYPPTAKCHALAAGRRQSAARIAAYPGVLSYAWPILNYLNLQLKFLLMGQVFTLAHRLRTRASGRITRSLQPPEHTISSPADSRNSTESRPGSGPRAGIPVRAKIKAEMDVRVPRSVAGDRHRLADNGHAVLSGWP